MNTEDTRTAPANPALTPDLAPYRLLREIGRGGMSVVYEALDTRTGKPAALKVLALPFSVTAAQRTELIARFRREERAVTQLSHPNIVAIQEIGERAEVHFIAMEYLPGESLRTRLERGPLSLPEAGAVLTQIASALTAVHGAGIVHRDVKPSNIMLLPSGRAKLLDFGVARHSDDTAITSGGLVVGSPAYLAPEQVRGGAGTAASDVWSLGVLLYEMLAGHPPFQATDVAAVMYQVIHEPPRPLSGLPPGLPKVLKRALDKAPERRFSSARALAEAFTAALPADRPAPARPRPVPISAGPLPVRLSRPAVLPRWVWGIVPLLFALALAGGFSGRRTPSPLSAPATALPAPKDALPASTLPPVSAALLPPAAVPVTAPAAVPPAKSVRLVKSVRPAKAIRPQVQPPLKAVRVPSVPAARRPRLARTPAATLLRHPALAAMRPRPIPTVRPHGKRLIAQPPLTAPHLALHPSRPRRSDMSRTETAALPLVRPVALPAPPEAGHPVPFHPSARPYPVRPRRSRADEDADDAARLQKFIWSEGR